VRTGAVARHREGSTRGLEAERVDRLRVGIPAAGIVELDLLVDLGALGRRADAACAVESGARDSGYPVGHRRQIPKLRPDIVGRAGNRDFCVDGRHFSSM